MTDPNSQPDLRHLTDQYELTEEELETTLSAVMATHAPEEDLWVFGYGSLMWQPEFPFEEQGLATVHGFHRSFCVYSPCLAGHAGRTGSCARVGQWRELPGYCLSCDRVARCVDRGIPYTT